jgi:hypothetical protein
MYVEIIGAIAERETIATGRRIRQLAELRRPHGAGRWRKLEGVAAVRPATGAMPIREKGDTICVDNRGAADLERRKVYRVLEDRKAAAAGYKRRGSPSRPRPRSGGRLIRSSR